MNARAQKIKGVYAICDNRFSPQYSHRELAQKFLEGGAKILQLRLKDEKNLSRVLAIAHSIGELKAQYDFCFILNDYVELAESVPVDGVHLGKEDLSIREARARLGDEMLIGYSSHSLQEGKEAEREGADYVAFGAIFPTQTKGPGHPVQGVPKLKDFVEKIRVPVVAIGGIGKSNFQEVLQTQVSSVAMITALTQAEDVSAATRFFVNRFEKERS